jgi:uncharacterized protein (TIGR03435 family)
MRRLTCGFTAVGVLVATRLWAQSPPAIEVASIRVHTPASGDRGGTQISGNRLSLSGNLKQLIIYAYDLKSYQVSGGPSWVTSPSIDTDYYDITATAEDPLTRPRAGLLLQLLLVDRFQLKLHQESKEMPVYALAVGKNGPKFKENTTDATCRASGHVTVTTVTSTLTRCPMDFLVRILSGAADRPVINQTGLPASYDLKLEFARDPAEASVESNSASIFTAVQEQLGLKLESQKAPVQVFVIDRAERPSEN